jgi:hypothetical protein
MGERKSEVFQNSHGPRVAHHWCNIRVYRGSRHLTETQSITCSLIPIAAWIALEITQNTSDAQSQTLVMHNHNLPSCTITNSRMHNHKPSCTITDQNPTYIEGYLNILYHPSPHHDHDSMMLLHVHAGKIFSAGKGYGRRFSKHTTSGIGNRRSVRGTGGAQRRISFCYDNHSIHSLYSTSMSD